MPAPEITGSYQAFRPYVRRDFRRCCAFCLLHEFWAGGVHNFEIDHFRPISLFPHLGRDYYNLYYICHTCNKAKGAQWPDEVAVAAGAGFTDFCRDDFETHFRLLPDGRLESLTASGLFTLRSVRLNSDHLVGMRAYLLASNHRFDAPPSDPLQ